MRRIGIAAALASTLGASCAQTREATNVSSVDTESHFRLVGQDAPPAARVAMRNAAAPPVPPAAPELRPAVAEQAAAWRPASAERTPHDVRPANFQPAVPPAPAAEGATSESLAESAGDPALAPVPETVGGLTLEQAVGTALACNPTLPEASVAVRQMRAEWAQAGWYPNPLLYYVGSNLTSGNSGQHGLYYQQWVVTADKLGWNRAVAAADISFAQAQTEAQRLRVEVDTTVLFYQAFGAQRLAELARTIQANNDRGLEATQNLFNAGQTSRADVLQAQVLAEQSGVAVRQAELAAEGAWRQLAAMMGQPDGCPPVPLAGSFEFEIPSPAEFDLVWERIKANSPDLASAAAMVKRNRARIGREEAESVGNIDAQLSLQEDFNTKQPLGYAQIGIPTPLFHANQGAIASAKAQYVRACREYERRTLELRSRLAATYQQAETARVTSERYRATILPAARENLELTRAGYARGEFDLIRLLTAQRTFAETNIVYVNAQIARRASVAQIDGLLLTGGLSEPTAPQGVAGGFGALQDVPTAP